MVLRHTRGPKYTNHRKKLDYTIAIVFISYAKLCQYPNFNVFPVPVPLPLPVPVPPMFSKLGGHLSMTETFRMRMNKNKKKFGLKMVMRHTQRDITTVVFRLYTAGLSLSLLWSIQLVIRWISNQRTRLAAFSFFFFT